MLSPVKIWRNQKKIRDLLGKKGKVIAFTKVFVPPQGFESQAPYIVAIALLENGVKIIAQVVDVAENKLEIGMSVITILRRTKEPDPEGIIPYGIKLAPEV